VIPKTTTELRYDLERLENILLLQTGRTHHVERTVSEIREELVERGEICPDCGRDVEYVDDNYRHVDPEAFCFLYPAREE
jgi:polyhydroxyalkanoate synthesis regulator phasin